MGAIDLTSKNKSAISRKIILFAKVAAFVYFINILLLTLKSLVSRSICNHGAQPMVRTAFLDLREKPEVAILSEFPKRAVIEWLDMYDKSGHRIFSGVPEVKILRVEEAHRFIASRYPFFTHQHVKISCEMNLSKALEYPLRVDMRITHNGQKCLARNKEISRGGVIPKVPNIAQQDIEICSAIIRASTSRVSRTNDVTSNWIKHVASFASRVNFYSDTPLLDGQINDHLQEAIDKGFLVSRHWPKYEPAEAKMEKHELFGERFGDYRVYGWSQSTALLDCIYDAASRNVYRVLVIDPDEFLLSDFVLAHEEKYVEYKMIDHHIQCPANSSSSRFPDRFLANFDKSVNVKSMYEPWTVKDLDCHRAYECVHHSCQPKRSPSEQGYIAHVKWHENINCSNLRREIAETHNA